MIRGYDSSGPGAFDPAPREFKLVGPAEIVVVVDTQDLEDMVVVGINAPDRPGLLLDISRGLHSLSLGLHHTEGDLLSNHITFAVCLYFFA